MTIKPTITVNGPRPTVAAVAAGNLNFIHIKYLSKLNFDAVYNNNKINF